MPKHPELHQHIFELDFKVDTLRASISKSSPDGVDKSLGDLDLEGFSLSFALAKYDMTVDVNLRYSFCSQGDFLKLTTPFSSVSMSVVQPSGQDIPFISTPAFIATSNKDLLRIAYTRVQQESPEFDTLYERVNQNVDIKVSTLVFRLAPEPVLALYDFIMTTFVSRSDQAPQIWLEPQSKQEMGVVQGDSDDKIRVLIKFEGVKGL